MTSLTETVIILNNFNYDKGLKESPFNIIINRWLNKNLEKSLSHGIINHRRETQIQFNYEYN